MKQNRFVILLAAIVGLLVLSPLVRDIHILSDSTISRLTIGGGFTLMLVSAVFAVSRSKWETSIALATALPVVVLQCAHVLVRHPLIDALDYLTATGFLTLVVCIITRFLFQTRTVTLNTICAAICVYLLLGIVWALLMSIVEVCQPASFTSSDNVTPANIHFGGNASVDALYFSYVTLTTLGFGDISPQRPFAKMLVSMEAVVGQLFLAILVARLVGLHITQAKEARRDGVS